MRSIISGFFLFFLSFSINAQENAKTPITSGIGVGELKLGMSEKEAIALLKGKYKERSYPEQLKAFRKDTVGYSIADVVQFIIGFDKCIVYERNTPENYPVFNLYFSEQKLIYITLTTYGIVDSLLNRFILDKALSFHEPMDKCYEFLGCDYISLHYKEDEYDGNHLYYNRGLELIYDDRQLAVICLFAPDKDLPRKMAGRRDQLIKEFRSIVLTD